MTDRDAARALTFTESVLARPAMYTLGGTFEEVVAFLEGYYSGIARGNPYADPVQEWLAFQDWLADEVGLSQPRPLREYRTLHPSSNAALLDLARRYAYFKQVRLENTPET
jgi:hypothetical protein